MGSFALMRSLMRVCMYVCVSYVALCALSSHCVVICCPMCIVLSLRCYILPNVRCVVICCHYVVIYYIQCSLCCHYVIVCCPMCIVLFSSRCRMLHYMHCLVVITLSYVTQCALSCCFVVVLPNVHCLAAIG